MLRTALLKARQIEPSIITLEKLPTDHTTELQKLIPQLIAERKKRCRQRLWDWLQIDESRYFIKTIQLDSLGAQLRATLNLRRRSGRWDWPIAELRNSRRANRITALGPKLLGFSKIRNANGLVSEVVLIHQDLEGHINGAQWAKRYPYELTRLIPRLINCITKLNSLNIYHLDLWLGNFMLTDNPEPEVRVIDFENCFFKKTDYLPETLGYQLGLLYEYELHQYLDESKYDQLVQNHAPLQSDEDKNRFHTFFAYYKHHGAGRKERYLIPHSGQHIV